MLSKGWHPTVDGTIALSGRFKLIESARDKEKKKVSQQSGKSESGLKLVERVTAGDEKKSTRDARRYKALFTPYISHYLF